MHELADRIGPPYDALVLVLAYGGLRWGEACALRRRHALLGQGRLLVAESLAEVNGQFHLGTTKTNKTRAVAIPRFLCERLSLLLGQLPADPDALLFVGPDGGPLRNNWFHRRVWDPARDQAGVPSDLRIHDLRHTCASLLIAQGAHPKMIQAHLGHSTIAVTFDVYGHIFDSDMEALARQLDRVYTSSAAKRPHLVAHEPAAHFHDRHGGDAASA